MKKTKQVMALLLALVMVVSMMPSNVQFVAATAAEDKIELGDETWSADGQAYTFSDVTVSFKSDQKIFCISVDNGGYFKFPKKIDLGNMSSSSDRMNGLTKSGEYTSSLSGDEELSSMTVIGSDITDEQIKNFLTRVVFYTGTTDQTVKQMISVVANSCSLPDGNSTAMAIDGKLHFYKYVEFPSGDNTSTWATAYKEAKKSVFEGLKGYLATITSENEEKYLYSSLGGDLQAWIGGARTLLPRDGYDGFVLDSNEITDEALKPLDDSNKIVRKWSWLCGPEAGTTFYETGESGNVYGGSVCDGQYADWNKNEPNNSYSGGGTSAYYQEYALEYGFEKANWNDYHPNNVSRSMWGIKGYIVEYSPYATSGESGKEDVDNKMTTPSTTELVVIQKSKPRLNADNLVLSKEQANKLTEATVKNLANTKGSYNGTTADASSSNITVDSGQLTTVKSAEAGTSNKLTFSYKYDTGAADVVTKDTTVYVTDVANTGSTSTNNTTTIGANNVSVTTDDLAACADEDKVAELIRSKAAPVAVKDGKAAVSADITQKSSEVSKASTAGTYKVTYTYNGVDTTINVTVTDSNPVAKVTADNFEVVRGSGNLTAADVITKSNARAKNSSGTVIPGATIDVDDTDLATLNDKIKNGPAGDYTVKVSSNGKTCDVTVTVRDRNVTIDANDFIITEDELLYANKDIIKSKANVRGTDEGTAFDFNDADAMDSTAYNELKQVKAGGSKDLTFTYTDANGKTTTSDPITAFVVKNKETNAASKTTIGANNVTYTTDQLKALGATEAIAAKIKSDSGVIAVKDGSKADASQITVKSGSATITSETPKGTYSVTYTCNGTDVAITVTVVDSGKVTEITSDKVELVVGDAALTAEGLLTKSNAKAKDASGNVIPDAKLTVDSKKLDIINKRLMNGPTGNYSVTVTTEDGFTADINVSIRKPVVSMTAEDFMLTKETAAALTGETAAKDYAKVGVTREGTTVADPFDKITANPDDLAKIVAGNSGTIGFKYENGKYETGSVTAKATVVDVKYSETKGTDRITIGADNVTLDYKDISSLPEDELKDLIRKNADPAATDNGALVDPSDISGPKLVKDGDGYKATFTYKDVPVTTDVVISNVPAQGEVNASDCIFSLDDIGKLTADDVIRAALSKYTDKNGVTDNGEGVVLTQESLDAINRMTEPGTLPLTFTDKSGTIVKKVTATVVQNRRYDTSTGNITLGANDFCITVEQAKTIVLKQDQTDVAEMLKKLGNAIATDDGKFIPFKDAAITADASAIQAAKGSYELVYTYKGKVNKVTVTVKDDGSADTTSSETTVPDVNLTANDFAVAAGTESIDETAFKKLAEVVAKYNDGSSVENVAIDAEDLAVLNEKIRAKSTDSVFVKVYATDKKTGKQLSAIVKVTLPKKAATPKPTKKPGTTAKPGSGISADDIAKELGVDKATAEKIKEYAEKTGTSMDTLRITDTAVKKLKDDKDIKGSDFSRLKARANKSSKNSITLKWVKQSGADGYLIYSNQCNQGGKKYRYKLTKTIKGKNKTTWTQKKRKKGKYYKYMVVAYKLFNGHKVTIAAAPTIHSVTKGGKRGMAKAVSIKKLGNKKKRAKITLKARKTAKIKAVEIRADKKKKIMKHRKLAYESSNVKVAKVTGSGKIKAVKKGKCKIWVYAQNGVYKEIKVTVK